MQVLFLLIQFYLTIINNIKIFFSLNKDIAIKKLSLIILIIKGVN